MAKADTSKGWCCDGRTYHEHAAEDGHCCQQEGTQLEELPEGGKQAAKQRLETEGNGGSEEPPASVGGDQT